MTNNDSFIITKPDRRRIALAQLKARLRIEIRTGMKASSRGPSTLAYCRQWGYEGPNRKEQALAWAIAELEAYA